MPITPLAIQKRMTELGRIRLGEKGPKGEPKKLAVFRFTSASEALLQAVAARYGGDVKPWEGAPGEGYFEVVTKSAAIDVVLPPVFSDANGEPTYPFNQWFELWSAGGCQRRCDGGTEALSGEACKCEVDIAKAAAQGKKFDRQCKPTTRVSVMMPDLPGLGVWRLESHGYNAAAEMPGTIQVLSEQAREGKFIPAVLRAEQRKKVAGGQTHTFVVPVIDLNGVTVNQIVGGEARGISAAPSTPLPALPPAPPEEEAEIVDAAPSRPKKATVADRKKLDAATDKLAELEPEIDWIELAEKAAVRAYDVGVAELNHDQIVQLAQRMNDHAATFAPVTA